MQQKNLAKKVSILGYRQPKISMPLLYKNVEFPPPSCSADGQSNLQKYKSLKNSEGTSTAKSCLLYCSIASKAIGKKTELKYSVTINHQQ